MAHILNNIYLNLKYFQVKRLKSKRSHEPIELKVQVEFWVFYNIVKSTSLQDTIVPQGEEVLPC